MKRETIARLDMVDLGVIGSPSIVVGPGISPKARHVLIHLLWFVLMQSCQVMQQFLVWHFRLPLRCHFRNEMPKEAQFMSFGIQEPVLQ
jgi:hypothetical protein